jgi:ParB-like chromosome segregation protein Spo0J
VAEPTIVNKIELWPIERLRPNPRNVRTHTDEQVRQLAGLIAEVGFNSAIAVDGEGKILKGHCTLLAARQLGLKKVPVTVLDHMTPEQQKVYMLGDNQIPLNAGWDTDLLREELLDLRNLGIEWDLMGFGAETINGLFTMPETAADPEPEPEDEPEPERGQPLAIVLQPDELRRWRGVKRALGLSLDRAALLRLVNLFLEQSDA